MDSDWKVLDENVKKLKSAPFKSTMDLIQKIEHQLRLMTLEEYGDPAIRARGLLGEIETWKANFK